MTDFEEWSSRSVTFSQARGYEELPGPVRLGEISTEARNELWNWLALNVWVLDLRNHRFYTWQPGWESIFVTLHRNFLKRPFDEFG